MMEKTLEQRLVDAERDLDKLKSKRWIEIAAVPLVIAATGYFASSWITSSQIASAEKISESQLAIAKERNASDQALKALELHIKYVNDPDPHVQVRAVELLSVLQPDLANKLREIVLTRKDDRSEVRDAARAVEIAGWFPVVRSIRDLQQAKEAADGINKEDHPYVAEVYAATDDKGERVYAVTLGGYLTPYDANQRVRYARQKIASDAFSFQSSRWGQNLLGTALPN